VVTDFFTVEVWTRRGLQRFIVLFFLDLSTRKVEIAGVAQPANGLWMSQIARNLTDSKDGILIGKRYLIHDRDPLFDAHKDAKTASGTFVSSTPCAGAARWRASSRWRNGGCVSAALTACTNRR
jgi:hypothetical protein